MRTPHALPLIALSLLAFTAGCHWGPSARQSHRDPPGSFSDQSARSAFVDNRIKELTDKGVSKEEAAGRASREWFSRAPVASETPTRQELKRREAQAGFEAELAKQKREASGQ